MKSVSRLVRRFVGITLLSVFVLLIVNMLALFCLMSGMDANGGPWTEAARVSGGLLVSGGEYRLSEKMAQSLREKAAFAMLIDNDSLQVLWHTDSCPEEIPRSYTLSAIADLTRGYIKDYPTFTAAYGEDLVVVGFPRTSYWKHMYPSWDYDFIANVPVIFLGLLLGNIIVIFGIYMAVNARLFRTIRPMVEGIAKLPAPEPVFVKPRGPLAELAKSVNETSALLAQKDRELKKRETARANWISGISHDIRTPLSMVMGYAGQLEEEPTLPPEMRKKAEVIRRQSERIKNLINDLNLASKLEYNMQPMTMESQNAVALVRQIVVDFMNMDIEEKYSIHWENAKAPGMVMILCDKALLTRAVWNLIQNCMNHNADGCRIFVSVRQEDGQCLICVEDDGCGVSALELERLQKTAHYMMCDDHTREPRHGLGLLIVRQILQAHHGHVTMEKGSYGGFKVTLGLPLNSNEEALIKNS